MTGGVFAKGLRALHLFPDPGDFGRAVPRAADCTADCTYARWGKRALTLIGRGESGWGCGAFAAIWTDWRGGLDLRGRTSGDALA